MDNISFWRIHIKQQLYYNNNMYAEFPMFNANTYNDNIVIFAICIKRNF